MKIQNICTTILAVCLGLNSQKADAQSSDIKTVKVKSGPVLGFSQASGVKIIKVKGKAFKDLNKNGKLDPYEDWRLTPEKRAEDLASKMTVEQIAGLMLYSQHQAIPASKNSPYPGTYDGKLFEEGNIDPSLLTDQQKKFLKEDNMRHVLITSVQSPEVAAKWNNNLQAYVEGLGLGIPANNSSDPRNTATVTSEFNAGAGGHISLWPDGLAMGATFDPDLVKGFGEIASQEYRALGISTALSPQIDLGTEPRWYRIAYVFSESPDLVKDMGKAYVEGFQTSEKAFEINKGWGYHSVNAMVKHWPGGGPEEGGRDGHWAMGKFAVYPGANFNDHVKPFTEGAFKLDGGTKSASAVMPYYTISYDQDKVYNENVGNGFSKYMITELLRDKYGYDDVVCTDWLITSDEGATPGTFAGKPWGVEDLSIEERHYKVLKAGVDQFGGNNEKAPVLAAYQMGVKEFGEEYMRARFERSAVRLLKNIFRVGLFENPYVDVDETIATVGKPEFMDAGYQAQLKSVIMLKNKSSVLPIADKKTVYIPKIYTPVKTDWWGNATPATFDYPVNIDLVSQYYNVTDDPKMADFAIVFVKNPQSAEAGYSEADRQLGGNGYLPISLQYQSYTSEYGREQSIAAGDPVVDPEIINRSYKGKTATASNIMDLKTIWDTKMLMKDKPVIVSVTADKPMIFSEFEERVEGIVLNFGVSTQAVLDIISGKAEPSGLLPLQMPANMKTVELQQEDVPFDMEAYEDAEGHVYDFGYGLNWSGVINDERTKRYKP
ncbi:glycoside hydrolase family 3 C-terminal domain-containing protein [Fulvivirga maritima]|uniref:glycoside hydrolase family 3 protein n=1 Tax=Fulvivirga maritima TaxID=2904247 RepID=UPI001F37D54C|nr:glycoside hydrolase family 3 N-terminal domain-containing protein [Fulvivirga maritima]UII27492.1 glycoside hydrolase family 3 C-terminal domain-containing protein [Fulvivirga maritima]